MEELRDHKGDLIHIGSYLISRNENPGSGVIVTGIDYAVEEVIYKYVIDDSYYKHGFNFIFEVWEVNEIAISELINKCISLLNKL